MTSSNRTSGTAWRLSQGGSRLDRTGICRPGGEDCALFIESEVGVLDDLHRMLESLRRVEEGIEIESAIMGGRGGRN